MYNREKLKNLYTKAIETAREIAKYTENNNEAASKNAVAKFSEFTGKFDYEAGTKSDIFQSELDNILQPFKCNADDVDNYMQQGSYHDAHRCFGIVENAALDLIDQMF